MVMDSMAIKSKREIDFKLKLLLSVTGAFFLQSSAFALEFVFVPSLTIQETYSDNIRLATKGFEQGAFVTEVSPGLSIRGVNGGRLSTSLDYQMQNLFNAGGDGSAQMFHQLQFNIDYILMRNTLFVDARSTYSQQNISNLRNGDNINNLNGRTNVWTAGTSVNWTPHFGNFADANVRVNFDYVANDNADQLSNSMNLTESVQLVSGLDFKRLTWVAAFNNTNNFRQNGDDVQFQNTNATIRGWVDRRFNFFATLGYANNSFQNLDTGTNGFFYTVGAQWKPNWYFDVEAGYGNNWHVTSNLSLTQRTHLSAGYFDRSVGLNTGGAWNASLVHNTKRSSWNFTYTEDTTTTQQILLEDTPFVVVDAAGNAIIDGDGQPVLFNVSIPTLTNDVLIRRTADISASYTTGKSVFQLGGFYERREYENSTASEQTIYGVDASWNWLFFRRTSLFFSPSWQRISGDTVNDPLGLGLNADQDRYQVITRLTRTLPLNIGRSRVLNASIEYRFLQQDSEVIINSYIENRVTASLLMNF